MSFIPKGYTYDQSTEVYTKESVPKMLLERHYTKKGVYGQIHVLSGTLKYFGYKGSSLDADKEVLVKAHETAMAHPNYFHRLEPASDDLKFEIHFFCLSNRNQNKYSK
ncbi:DUF1971 domain-containing protein [Shewanella sp. VB17]|uniref:DUF1971 domain-containing protein n=1 Tax=Shewanella sp. VB17 TaxID=2739432 RepID=UPI0015673602|nr:DUF1971 domain-containing protein [Shewanella sp. VB17]NRD72623.1 DUF1971 domain-containing protein [Shewanella sp. VB17]